MIGTVPVAALAPLDYRYALDAARALLVGNDTPMVICNVAALAGEAQQRIPQWNATAPAPAALWVEPLAATWHADLAMLANGLARGAPLVIVASRPLARMLPERRAWPEPALGLQPGGIWQLRRALARVGFALEANHGIHAVSSIALGLLSRQAERWGRPDLGDRLHFAARLRYRAPTPFASLSTVALLFARNRTEN